MYTAHREHLALRVITITVLVFIVTTGCVARQSGGTAEPPTAAMTNPVEPAPSTDHSTSQPILPSPVPPADQRALVDDGVPVPTVTPTVAPRATLRLPVAVGDGTLNIPLPNPKDLDVGTVVLSVNGAHAVGAGSATLRDDQISLGLQVGDPDWLFVFAFSGPVADSSIAIPVGRTTPVILAQDIALKYFEVIPGAATNRAEFELVRIDATEDDRDPVTGWVTGEFHINTRHFDGTELAMSGVFHIPAHPSEWTCDPADLLLSNCKLIDE